MPLTDIIAAVDARWQRGCEEITLGGGEPTLHPQLTEILRHIRNRGLALHLITNGRRFAEPGYAARMARAGNLRRVEIGLHGTAAIHDAMTRDASFGQAHLGAAALLEAGVEVVLTCRVSTENLEALPALVDLVGTTLPGAVLELRPLGAGPDALAEDPRRTAVAVGRQLTITGPRLRARGFPICLLPQADPRPVRGSRQLRPPICAGCADFDSCAGLDVPTIRRYGDSGLRPRTSARRPVALAEVARVDTALRYPDTALITLIVPSCEMSCVFCDVPQGRVTATPSTLASVRDALDAMEPHTTGVLFTGGEPTSLAWLHAALAHARELGYARIQMQSNAAMASQVAYADALVSAGLTAIDVPIYAAEPAAHDGITRTPGSHARTLAGVANLQARGVAVVVHVTLMADSGPWMPSLGLLIDELAAEAAYMQPLAAPPPGTPVTPEGGPPTLEQAAASARALLRNARTRLMVSGVPSGMLPGFEDRVLGPRDGAEHGVRAMTLPYGDWLRAFSGGDAQ